MNEVLSHEEIGGLIGLYAAIEQRFAELLLVSKPRKSGLLSLLTGRSLAIIPASYQSVWQQETEKIARALAANNRQELASLMNLHALNAAIEAARFQDATLARQAERLRRLAEQARNFKIKE